MRKIYYISKDMCLRNGKKLFPIPIMLPVIKKVYNSKKNFGTNNYFTKKKSGILISYQHFLKINLYLNTKKSFQYY